MKGKHQFVGMGRVQLHLHVDSGGFQNMSLVFLQQELTDEILLFTHTQTF